LHDHDTKLAAPLFEAMERAPVQSTAASASANAGIAYIA
jgi:hypothetical protein